LHNLVGAAAAAECAGASPEQIAAGINAFHGVRRRLELKFHRGGLWIYDDFAHHPTAVQATLSSLRARHPQAYLLAAFEPRSNTSVRRYFQQEIGAALGLAQRIAIGAIHRADKIPSSQRLNVEQVVQALRSRDREAEYIPDPAAITEYLLRNLPEESVIVLMSNGAFFGLSGRLLEKLGN
jgi:UDP-N-acetylmuramate: L-alanyl-gamma-D-glutamyl-meso-diaminopimelate ligase